MLDRRCNIVHIITDLETGGAQSMLYNLLSRTNRSRFEPSVIVMMNAAEVGESIRGIGVPVEALGMRPERPIHGIPRFVRAARILRKGRPRIIQSWMYHANVLALLAASLLPGQVPVAWNVRQSLYSLGAEKALTRLFIRVGALLSKRAAAIVYNSLISAQQHEGIGYAAQRRRVIPNGFDTDLFQPSAEARTWLRMHLGFRDSTTLIGLVARYHPMKDHRSFIHAATLLAPRYPNAGFVLAGRGVDENNVQLSESIRRHHLADRVRLLGQRFDTPRITAALDIATCCSWSEGFPNVIGEAMACGVPCVVTDVGESARIVGETGIVVPPRDPQALAAGWQALIEKSETDRSRIAEAARDRILRHYSLDAVVRLYQEFHMSLAEGHICAG